MLALSGKIALVTGAASGIGAGIAQAFVAEGATTYLTDINDNAGRTLADSLGANARYVSLDVREEDQWRSVTNQIVAAHGRLDIVVNNAGILGFEAGAVPHDPENASLEDWRNVHRTNLDGVFLGCKYAIKAMRPRGVGAIINMSSRSGLVGVPGAAAYASSKAAVRNHTKSVAIWCAEQGLNIRCNSIHPGAILTPIWDHMLGHGHDREDRIRDLAERAPQRRWGAPDEVAAVAVLLASDRATFMTGSEIVIDGGQTASVGALPASVR